NLKSERGRRMFEEMVKTADVVVENLGPGSMDRVGIGFENLSRITPRIIAASVKGFGTEGPYASYNSFEMIAQAMGGVMSLTGAGDGPPTRIEAGVGDTGAGLHLAIGILAPIGHPPTTRVGPRAPVAPPDAVVNLTRL